VAILLISRLYFTLYGLTDEEIAIVEGKDRKK
jgi:hypothetical protein